MRKLFTLGIFHRFLLLFSVIPISYFYLGLDSASKNDPYGWIIFVMGIVAIMILFITTELKILTGKIVIVRTIRTFRFDKQSLLFILFLLAFIASFYFSNYGNSSFWNWNHLMPLLPLVYVLVRRDNYYSFSKKKIKYIGNVSSDFKIDEISEIQETVGGIQLIGETISMLIEMESIKPSDRKELMNRINEIKESLTEKSTDFS
ncbi:MAG: hypothetical protein N4A41_00105 [Crocinitomicaceae bacterium]|nr:hypothetical protein [Crocinitomicaceae bacterium]